MPILTFFNYLYAFTQGPYYRTIGRHTRRYCIRAAQKANGETAKKVLMVAAVGAEELLAPLLGVSRHDKTASLRQGVKAVAVTTAMRIYLSALLITMGENKAALLNKTGMAERELLRLWCAVFDYRPEDMRRFDQELIPAYQLKGFDGLATTVCTALARLPELQEARPEVLSEALRNDIAASIRILET